MPREASPATDSPATTATASGRNSGSTTVSAVSATKIPLAVIEKRNGGPSRPSFTGAVTLIAIAMTIGIAASTARIARLRRRRNTMPSSERRNRVLTTGGRRTAGRGGDRRHLSR